MSRHPTRRAFIACPMCAAGFMQLVFLFALAWLLSNIDRRPSLHGGVPAMEATLQVANEARGER